VAAKITQSEILSSAGSEPRLLRALSVFMLPAGALLKQQQKASRSQPAADPFCRLTANTRGLCAWLGGEKRQMNSGAGRCLCCRETIHKQIYASESHVSGLAQAADSKTPVCFSYSLLHRTSVRAGWVRTEKG